MLSILRDPHIALQHNEQVLSAAKKRKLRAQKKRGHDYVEHGHATEGLELLKWSRKDYDVDCYQVTKRGGPKWQDVVLRVVVDLYTSRVIK